MDQLTRLPSGELDTPVGVAAVRVRIQGLPEDVQRIADGVDAVFPGEMEWNSVGDVSVDNLIEVSGTGMRPSDMGGDGFGRSRVVDGP